MNLSKQKCKEICDIVNRIDKYFTEIKKDLPKIVTILTPSKKDTKKQSKFDTKSKAGSVKPKSKFDKKSERFSVAQSFTEDFRFDKDEYTRRDSQDLGREDSDRENYNSKRKEINLYEKEKSVKSKKTPTKAVKPKKDENAPKSPLSSFFLFMNQKKEDVKKEYPTLASKQLVKVMGQVWRSLTDQQKKPYIDSANASYAKYKAYLAKQKSGNRNSMKVE